MDNVPVENMVKNAISLLSLPRNIPVVFGKQFTMVYENTEDTSGANGCLLSDQPAVTRRKSWAVGTRHQCSLNEILPDIVSSPGRIVSPSVAYR